MLIGISSIDDHKQKPHDIEDPTDISLAPIKNKLTFNRYILTHVIKYWLASNSMKRQRSMSVKSNANLCDESFRLWSKPTRFCTSTCRSKGGAVYGRNERPTSSWEPEISHLFCQLGKWVTSSRLRVNTRERRLPPAGRISATYPASVTVTLWRHWRHRFRFSPSDLHSLHRRTIIAWWVVSLSPPLLDFVSGDNLTAASR